MRAEDPRLTPGSARAHCMHSARSHAHHGPGALHAFGAVTRPPRPRRTACIRHGHTPTTAPAHCMHSARSHAHHSPGALHAFGAVTRPPQPAAPRHRSTPGPHGAAVQVLVQDKKLKPIGDLIVGKYEQAVETLLELRAQHILCEDSHTLRSLLAMRQPYTIPVNFLQVRGPYPYRLSARHTRSHHAPAAPVPSGLVAAYPSYPPRFEPMCWGALADVLPGFRVMPQTCMSCMR